jgi:hypothetical protein
MPRKSAPKSSLKRSTSPKPEIAQEKFRGKLHRLPRSMIVTARGRQ